MSDTPRYDAECRARLERKIVRDGVPIHRHEQAAVDAALAHIDKQAQTIERLRSELERLKPEYATLDAPARRYAVRAVDERMRAEKAEAEVAALGRSLKCLFDDTPQLNGEYIHTVTCNGDRRKPIGTPGAGCSCPIGRRIVRLVKRLREEQ